MAVALSGLALVIVVAFLLFRSPAPQIASADQPNQVVVVSTSPPAGGAQPLDGVVAPPSCLWSDFQPIARRHVPQSENWQNVGLSGSLTPEVVVTLEQVSFCKGQIAITWSVRNNMEDESVALPLTAENIAVIDTLGNTYAIADEKSLPPQISVAPRSKARGTAVIVQPASLNARTLKIKLKKLPFGEATWIVPINNETN